LLARGAEKKYTSFTERAVARYPDDAALRLEYATALAIHEPEQSRAEALKVAELATENELERAALVVRAARLLLELGDTEGARSLADLLAGFAQWQVMIRNELTGLRGAIAASTGDPDHAEQQLRAAHRADPIHSVFAFDLAELFAARGRREEALVVIERTLSTPERPGFFEARAGRRLERLREELQTRSADSNGSNVA
jgi:thioredoxin-like negative regulator of GroEL